MPFHDIQIVTHELSPVPCPTAEPAEKFKARRATELSEILRPMREAFERVERIVDRIACNVDVLIEQGKL